MLTEWSSTKGIFKYCKGQLACLTMIKKYYNTMPIKNSDGSVNKELTLELIEDVRIPEVPANIEVDNLVGFAEWQRRLDNIG